MRALFIFLTVRNGNLADFRALRYFLPDGDKIAVRKRVINAF